METQMKNIKKESNETQFESIGPQLQKRLTQIVNSK